MHWDKQDTFHNLIVLYDEQTKRHYSLIISPSSMLLTTGNVSAGQNIEINSRTESLWFMNDSFVKIYVNKWFTENIWLKRTICIHMAWILLLWYFFMVLFYLVDSSSSHSLPLYLKEWSWYSYKKHHWDL